MVFDQSRFVRTAIETLLHEGGIGLFLTCVMILMFLGSLRATVAVFFSIPLSVCATFFVLQLGGSSINSMVLGGLALALSRLIDNSVVVLENIYRHLEMGEPPRVAAETGGKEVALPVLASTLTTAVVFFPVTLLAGVSKFLFSAMALAVVVSLFASYIVAMTVVPLFCARYLKLEHSEHKAAEHKPGWGARFNTAFNRGFQSNARTGTKCWSSACSASRRPCWLLFFVAFAASLLLIQPARILLLPANRRRPVRHHLQGAFGNQAHRHRERSRESRELDQGNRPAGRSRHHRRQHRRR